MSRINFLDVAFGPASRRARELVTGTIQGEKSHGGFWTNDKLEEQVLMFRLMSLDEKLIMIQRR